MAGDTHIGTGRRRAAGAGAARLLPGPDQDLDAVVAPSPGTGSSGFREQHDEFPLIGDPAGKMVVGQFGLSIPDFLDGFDDTVSEGDVLLTFEEPGEIAIHDDRWLTYPWGVNGGTPGARGTKWLERADGTRHVLPSKGQDVPVHPGDVLHFVTWGGGGWGDPLERDPALVDLEVRRGLVTVEGARRYGIVIGDEAATTALRTEMRAARPAEMPVFDMGPPMETILANCEAETGLPAPRRPAWT